MFKYNKWQRLQAVSTKGKSYTIYKCPKCTGKSAVQTKYCANCGKHLIRGKTLGR